MTLNNLPGLLHPVWAEISLGNFIHNVRVIKKIIPSDTKLLAVVKANAYGHGAIELGKLACDNGAYMLAVSSIKEALSLRDGISNDVRILVLGYTCDSLADIAVSNDIRLCIYTKHLASSLSKVAVSYGKYARIHIKLDTGMGRIGYQCSDNDLKEIEEISRLPNIIIEGIFTHFATADEDSDYLGYQMKKYMAFVNKLRNIGISPDILHCANSASLILHSNTHMNMVRAGIVLYGLKPSYNMNIPDLRPVMSLKTKIVNIKYISSGESVSYGRSFIADSAIKVATLPIGYADGYMRSLSNRAKVLVNGRLAKVIGNICMDQCMIDVTSIDNVRVGDEVTMFGKDHLGNEISVDELARTLNTINYEVITNISNRVTKVFK